MDEKNKEYWRLDWWSGLYFYIGMTFLILTEIFLFPVVVWNKDPNSDPLNILISLALTTIMGIISALIFYKKVRIDKIKWRLFKEY